MSFTERERECVWGSQAGNKGGLKQSEGRADRTEKKRKDKQHQITLIQSLDNSSSSVGPLTPSGSGLMYSQPVRQEQN